MHTEETQRRGETQSIGTAVYYSRPMADVLVEW